MIGESAIRAASQAWQSRIVNGILVRQKPQKVPIKCRSQFIGAVSRLVATIVVFFSYIPIPFGQLAHGDPSPEQDQALRKGLIAIQENRLQDALVALTAAERDYPSNPRVHNFRGIVLAQLGHNAEATDEYEEAIRLDSRLEDAYRNLGFIRWTEQRLEPAREALTRAVELSPTDSFAHYYLGRVQLDAQVYSEAFRELETSGVPWPSDPQFLIEATAGYLALGESERARRVAAKLVPLSLTDTQCVELAPLFLALHENQKAIDLFTNANARQRTNADLWDQFDLALVYLHTGNYEKAIDEARSYIHSASVKESESSRMAPAWSLVGISHARAGHGDPAVAALRKTVSLAPDREEDWLNLTRELMELGRLSDAISAVQDGIALNPTSYSLHLRLGAAHLAAGQYIEAESVFRKLVTAGDPLPTSYVGLAQVLLRTGRFEESVSELTAARQKLGPNFLISYFLGLSLDRAGKRPEAKVAFQEALRLNKDNAEVHLGLGKTDLALGLIEEATIQLREALRLNPGNVRARRLLSHAYRRAGDTQHAMEYADASREIPADPQGDLVADFFLPEWQIPAEKGK